MPAETALSIILTARDNTQAGLNSAKAGMSSLERAVSATSVATHALSGIAGAELVGALSDAAREGATMEAATNRVRVAVDNTGKSYQSQSGAINEAMEAGKKLSFGHTELSDSFALLVEQTDSAEEAIKRQRLAMELSRGAHIDLYTASKLLGKVTDDNVKVLGRYGIQVRKGADEAELFATIQRKFGGQAEEYGKSTAGGIDRMRYAIEEWKGSIGSALGPAQGFIALLPGISSGMTLAGGAAGGLSTALKGLQASMLLALGPIALIVAGLAIVAVKAQEASDANKAVFTPEDDAQYVAVQKSLRDAGLSYDAAALAAGTAKTAVKSSADVAKESMDEMARGASASADLMNTSVTTAAQGMKDKVVTIFDQMKTAGVGNAQLMETDTILAAMGMDAGVRQAAADMEAGVTGKTAEQREKIILDMQTAKLQATQRAAGMSEEVIAAIDRMVFDSRTKMQMMKDEQAAKFDAMMAKGKNLDGSLDENTAAVGRLKWAIDSLQSKEINVTVNRISAFQNSERTENPPLFAHGGQMMAGPSYGGAKVAIFGEAGNESATFQRSDGSGYQGGAGGVTEIHTNLYLDGAQIAPAMQRVNATQARRSGITNEALAR